MDLEITYSPGADGQKTANIPARTKEWALSFIAEESAKGPSEIAAVVQQGHDEVLDAIANLTDRQAMQKDPDDDWSVLEAMAHVVTTKQIVTGLTASLAAGSRPPGIGPEWEEESAQDGITNVSFESLEEARSAAESAHAGLLSTIQGLNAANTDVRFRHYIFGAMNAREWALFQRVHDGDHIAQLRKIVSAVLATS